MDKMGSVSFANWDYSLQTKWETDAEEMPCYTWEVIHRVTPIRCCVSLFLQYPTGYHQQVLTVSKPSKLTVAACAAQKITHGDNPNEDPQHADCAIRWLRLTDPIQSTVYLFPLRQPSPARYHAPPTNRPPRQKAREEKKNSTACPPPSFFFCRFSAHFPHLPPSPPSSQPFSCPLLSSFFPLHFFFFFTKESFPLSLSPIILFTHLHHNDCQLAQRGYLPLHCKQIPCPAITAAVSASVIARFSLNLVHSPEANQCLFSSR